MRRIARISTAAWIVAAVFGGAGSAALAQDKKVTEPEVRYQAGSSPLAGEEMHQNIDPKAPPMTKAEFDQGRQIYFQRCAGCHGVLRKGATGKPLTPDITMARGTEILKTFIKYGSPAGMPNWGTSGEMTDAEIDLMARYVQQQPPTPPEFGMEDMKKTWKVIVAPDKRPTKKMNKWDIDNLFSVTLRDTGEVALIDGASKPILTSATTSGFSIHMSIRLILPSRPITYR